VLAAKRKEKQGTELLKGRNAVKGKERRGAKYAYQNKADAHGGSRIRQDCFMW
jgi:hypothetical protein